MTALFPLKGIKYKGELMVVGRSINTLGNENDNIRWNPKDGNPTAEIITNIINYSSKKQEICPLDWIPDHWGWDAAGNRNPDEDHYNMKKSAFWRVIKEILSGLRITVSNEEKESWSRYIVWSNLYKIAPVFGGNPSIRLRNAQIEQCKLLLKEEIDYFQPKRILFLTGYDWFWFFESIGFSKTLRIDALVEWVGVYREADVIVAKHPQGKDETEYIEQVVKYFQ